MKINNAPRSFTITSLFSAFAILCLCNISNAEDAVAPGAPGVASHWSYAGKTGIGTSYETYTDGQYKDGGKSGKISKVWFSIAQGVVTETMFGLIHEAQLQEMQFFIQGDNFLHEEKLDTVSQIDYLDKDDQGRPLSLAYKIINRDKQGRYEIEKHIFTDPENNTLMMKVIFRSFADNITPYLYINPNMANTGPGDKAWQENNFWLAADGDTHLAIKTDATIIRSTVGFEGVSDGLNELHNNGKLIHAYQTTGDTRGNVAMTLQLPNLKKNQTAEWQFVLGFGHSKAESISAATNTLARGYKKVLREFNGQEGAVGWETYLNSLPELKKLATISTDNGKLLFASAMILKAQEDKTYAGAVIASLSNPWGDSASADKTQTGYKAVWPRDFYQVTMALLALGDTQTPKVAFNYLRNVQVTEKTKGYSGTPGWFLQKTHVDGEMEWVGVQLDQTAMPIMLGWRLWKEKIISDTEIKNYYASMIKPAANFLAVGGQVNLDWNHSLIKPPFTQQERWEEQAGYSPSTTAAVIAGLIAAADIAQISGDVEQAKKWINKADEFSKNIEATMFTDQGLLNTAPANGKYFLRINPQETTANKKISNENTIGDRNGQLNVKASEVVDAGFLELVRYGVRLPSNAAIVESLPEIDNTQLPDGLRVKYEFSFAGYTQKFPGWRRYGMDGYGEDTIAGRGYNATGKSIAEGRGRVWPIFTGERGQYELAKVTKHQKINSEDLNKLRNTYIKAMELFANSGFMIPEQVWDGVGDNSTYHFTVGQGTNSATPLAWSHAEYIKLLRSYSDQKIWDLNSSTAEHFRSTQKQ